MTAVMIGIDPHKASHTAVVISAAEEPLGDLRVRACVAQAERLPAWLDLTVTAQRLYSTRYPPNWWQALRPGRDGR